MRYPAFIPNPTLMTDQGRIFRPGGIVETILTPLPIGEGGRTFGLPGPVPADVWSVLDHAAQIVHRITPWAAVYAVPNLVFEFIPDGYPCREVIRHKESGKDYARAGGISFNDEDIVALSLHSYSMNLISTAYHEAWHQVEKILEKIIIDEIDRSLVPLSWGSAYADSMVERRARCFEMWCMYYEEGMPVRGLSTWLDGIFDGVATGEVAREWMKEQ